MREAEREAKKITEIMIDNGYCNENGHDFQEKLIIKAIQRAEQIGYKKGYEDGQKSSR